MSEIKLDVGNIANEQHSESKKMAKQNSEFLANLNNHNIAKVFADFKKEQRILVVPVGFPQAGKSLLLSSLMYYSRNGKEVLFRTNVENDFPYDRGRIAVDQMIDYFNKGKLYEATRVGTLDLIGINIHPSKTKLPSLKLAFLDLAGEDVKQIKTSENHSFTEKIDAVFNGIKIDNSPVIFTLITPYEPAKNEGETLQDAHNREDTLHYDFLNYIKQSQPELLKNSKFFIIASQWDKNPNENDSVEEFIKSKRPSIYNYVKDSNVIWGQYSIGKLLVSNVEGVKVQEIVRINYDYPARFWKKLYQICTGNSLENKSFLAKLFGY
jgi:hypothetical protein